ncbi:RusA family crossover junction endodeoxyribonuclease [Candidatus Methylacidithermus pantelleriae]|uniref:Putative Crossover junction endodeoxyribonuclease RusA n=1 Tax=Candidatus Methylacidithermus pantelleriae TaxID=2744239 RepID=A0A8J2FWP6_9BACT|nr:RusA family crossover junction endodeoxyribonuclease [Candidatus Methylacidithermus pantelleriae]CAF0700540.1 putative Crossover junction endodeoxyribonuclease RusA [Candidatus Methylacidithermus pantelleriae]
MHHRAFVVEGEPIAKGSKVSFVHKSGKRVVIDSNQGRVQGYVYAIRVSYRAKYGEEELLCPPIAAKIVFYFTVPKHLRVKLSKKKIDTWKATRPDVDKLIRCVLDSLSGLAFVDDSEIVRVEAEKHVTDGIARTEIELVSLA